MNQVIKTIVPLAPLCSPAQESLIGAVSAHRQVVLQSVSCSKEHADSIRRPRAPPPRTDTGDGYVSALSVPRWAGSRHRLMHQDSKPQFYDLLVEGMPPFEG